MKNKKSLFVVIEGVDFSGKTTLIEKLKILLKDDEILNNYFDKVLYTKEPNEKCSEFCKTIRKIAVETPGISDLTRSLLFFANRSEHINKFVKPEIEKGACLVICDRFYLSTLVYQAKDDPKIIKWVKETQKLVSDICPDRTYLVKIDRELLKIRWEKQTTRSKDLLDEFAYMEFESVNNRYDRFIGENEKEVGPVVYLHSKENENWPLAYEIQKDLQEVVKGFLANNG